MVWRQGDWREIAPMRPIPTTPGFGQRVPAGRAAPGRPNSFPKGSYPDGTNALRRTNAAEGGDPVMLPQHHVHRRVAFDPRQQVIVVSGDHWSCFLPSGAFAAPWSQYVDWPSESQERHPQGGCFKRTTANRELSNMCISAIIMDRILVYESLISNIFPSCRYKMTRQFTIW
jgi:hypothetical protein